MIYAGIGSRATPQLVLDRMVAIAKAKVFFKWTLRSGGASGADKAFEFGCDERLGRKEIWLPWAGFNGSDSQHVLPASGPILDRALNLAKMFHPAWHKCSPSAQRLHARNILQIMGGDLQTPADLVICWTPGARFVGGTATALSCAAYNEIKIENLVN